MVLWNLSRMMVRGHGRGAQVCSTSGERRKQAVGDLTCTKVHAEYRTSVWRAWFRTMQLYGHGRS